MVKSLYILLSVILMLENKGFASSTRRAIPASRFEHLSGVKTEKSAKIIWDKKYSTASYVYGKAPAKFLAENFTYLPLNQKVLDMGMGEGRNAVFLAKKGFRVTGIDISSVAIKKAKMLAKEFGVQINTVVASLKDYPIRDGEFDAIICFYYVDRSLFDKIQRWLRPGGILIYGSFTQKQLSVKGFDANNYKSDNFLRPQELLSLFPEMRVLKYEEPLHEKNFEANIILQKNLNNKIAKNSLRSAGNPFFRSFQQR